MMSLALVTGVTGAVVKELLAQERSVRCLVRNIELAEQLKLDSVEFVAGDLNDEPSLARAF